MAAGEGISRIVAKCAVFYYSASFCPMTIPAMQIVQSGTSVEDRSGYEKPKDGLPKFNQDSILLLSIHPSASARVKQEICCIFFSVQQLDHGDFDSQSLTPSLMRRDHLRPR
ncbi:hypothetical protein HAX54_038813 [Datura stramonium]|uniref:Uncharacterized protein n=1 Tax=Datura stramonium TaxID=4076 RepID=A0ABS8SI99_DATST|nr:hypothetical protein [Datura stramonium]